MRSNKKYKGKCTKKRLKNLVRGSMFLYKYRNKHDIELREMRVAQAWCRSGKITLEQCTQWGY